MEEQIIIPQEDLRKLQLIQLEMLLEVDRICRENNIEYFLSAGTLLGAVRHEGFIPWDDDLDLRMRRKEFDKFFNICKKELNDEKFFLQTYKTDPEYRWGYAKVRRKGTQYIRKGQEAIKCVSGVSIDIFIIDNLPDNKVVQIAFHYIRRICIKTLWSVVGVTEEKNGIKRLLYRGLRHVNKNLPLRIFEMMARYTNRKESEYEYCISFYRKNGFSTREKVFKPKVKTKWFKEKVELTFEGFKFYACKDYIEYLSSKYGNFWEYPPMSERYIHPPSSYNLDIEIDLRGRSVEEYMNKEYIYKTKEEMLNG